MTDTPDLCDCEGYDDQSLCIGKPNPDGAGHLYTCAGCGYDGVVV